jgi:hypothetical protein
MIRCQRCNGEVYFREVYCHEGRLKEHYCLKCSEIVHPDGRSITWESGGHRLGSPWVGHMKGRDRL